MPKGSLELTATLKYQMNSGPSLVTGPPVQVLLRGTELLAVSAKLQCLCFISHPDPLRSVRQGFGRNDITRHVGSDPGGYHVDFVP